MYYRLTLALADGKLVLQFVYYIAHLGKYFKVLQLTQHIHGLLHHLAIVLRQRHVGYGEIGVGIAVELVLIDLYWRIVAKLVRAHHLNVALHSAHRHPLCNALEFVKGIATGFNQIVERPSAITVPQTVVYSLVPYKCILISRHSSCVLDLCFSKCNICSAQSICVVEKLLLFFHLHCKYIPLELQ